MGVVAVTVKWGKYQEIVQIDLDGLRRGYSEVTRTTETDGNKPYQWVTTSEFTPNNQGAGTLTISYRPDDNPELGGRWGRAIYHLNKGMMRGKVEWIDDDDDPKYVVEPVSWTRFSPRANLLQKKERESVERIARRQAELRKKLLLIDPRCAITGETEQVLLEAAHVIPAAKKGSEIPENGLLLRADLHRLYDSGLIVIKLDGTVKADRKLKSREYIDLLRQFPAIDSTTLARIRAALKTKMRR